MNTPDENEKLAENAKSLFDDSVERLDAATLSKLNQGRHAALESAGNSRSTRPFVHWMPVTGIAAAALIAVVVMRGPNGEIPVAPGSTATDFEILLSEDNLEMLEDLEFYFWIDPVELETNNVG